MNPPTDERGIDQKLVARVQKGDKTAFDLLVRKYQHRVIKLVGRYVHDRADAEDVAQEAFLRAYRALGGFRGESAFYTWLYRIAVNTAKNHLEARGRRPLSLDADPEGMDMHQGNEALHEQGTPERHLLTDEIASTVRLVLEHLPSELRTALTLREMDGLSYEEIADIMECPVGTVRSRIFRAREAVDAQLRPLLKR